MAKVVEAAETVEAVAGEVIDEVAKTVAVVPRSVAITSVGFACGLGVAIGFFATKHLLEKRLQTKYSEIAEEEISEMREHFRARLVVKEEKPDLTDLAKRTQDLQYSKPTPEGGPGAPVLKAPVPVETRNVFQQQEAPPVGAWDYEAEKALREALKPGEPFVIHEDERHDEDAVDYAEATLTWYAGDDVLCDDDDRALSNVDELIGLHNLQRFGDGTEDENVMFVRNDRLEVIMEINRSPNSYSEEVHGFAHSEEPRRRRGLPKWDD